MKHIQTLNGATLKASAAKGGCGRVPDFLSVRLQDFLHGCQPEVREPVIFTGSLGKGQVSACPFSCVETPRPGTGGQKGIRLL